MADEVVDTGAATAAPVADATPAVDTGSSALDEMLSIGATIPDAPSSQDTLSGQPPPDAGKQAAPEPGKDGSATDQKAGTPPPPDKGKDGVTTPSEDELAARLSLSTTPEQEQARKDRDLAASSREAQRLVGEIKAVESMLAAQGLKRAKDDNGEWQLVKSGKAKDPEVERPNLDSLSRKDAKAFETMLGDEDTEADAVWDFVAERVGPVIHQAAPTVENVVQPISDERKQLAIHEVVEKSGDMYPRLQDSLGLLGRAIEGAPREIKRAYNAHPEIMTRLFAADIEAAHEWFSRKARDSEGKDKQKEETSRHAGDFSHPVGGTAELPGSGASNVAASVREMIVNAE